MSDIDTPELLRDHLQDRIDEAQRQLHAAQTSMDGTRGDVPLARLRQQTVIVKNLALTYTTLVEAAHALGIDAEESAARAQRDLDAYAAEQRRLIERERNETFLFRARLARLERKE